MNIAFKKTTRGELQIGLSYLAVSIFGFAFAQFGEHILIFIPPCLFRVWTGLPCPTCGATRTGIALSHFYFLDALFENPLFFMIYAALFLWGMNTILGVVTGKNVKFSLSGREKKRVQILLVSAIALNWLYLILKTIH